MAPAPPGLFSAFGQRNPAQIAADEAQQRLLDELNMNTVPKAFKNPSWKPNQRRNKSIKLILGDATRKESQMPTQDNSEAATPLPDDSGASTAGDSTPAETPAQPKHFQPNLTQASQSLSKLVLERNMKNSGFSLAPNATYTNIEAPPSVSHSKHYCDITGLPTSYTDPKTGLRYHNKEMFGVIRSLGQGVPDQYLEARGAKPVLK